MCVCAYVCVCLCMGVGDMHSHIRYWHLPRNTEMHLTLRALCGPRKLVTLGHCSFCLFSKKGRLKSGRKKVIQF